MTLNAGEYTAGQIAARMGKSRDSNPYLLPPNPRGISMYTNDNMGGDWARGFRDELEVMRRAKQGPTWEESYKRGKRR